MLQPGQSENNLTPNDAPASERERAQRNIVLEDGWRAGRKLEEARKQLGLSLQEVSERIRVRREFLEALETMNVKLLPGKAYTLAFLKSYAKTLGLDEAAIVEQFQEESALSREDAQKQIRDPESRPHAERPWLFAAAIVLFAGAFVGYRALQHENPAAEQAAQGAAFAPASPSAAGAPAAGWREERTVEIRAVSEAWLEARGPDGTVFLSRTLQPGDVFRPDASPGWTLHARDGGAFEVFVSGSYAGLLGDVGKPVLGRQIDQIQPIAQAQAAQRGG
jgi:transcriptional regulator with XRE-family HTH domain